MRRTEGVIVPSLEKKNDDQQTKIVHVHHKGISAGAGIAIAAIWFICTTLTGAMAYYVVSHATNVDMQQQLNNPSDATVTLFVIVVLPMVVAGVVTGIILGSHDN